MRSKQVVYWVAAILWNVFVWSTYVMVESLEREIESIKIDTSSTQVYEELMWRLNGVEDAIETLTVPGETDLQWEAFRISDEGIIEPVYHPSSEPVYPIYREGWE